MPRPGLLLLALCGCSVERYAVTRVGDALARSGGSFASDDDPDLVRDAAPFSLKLLETLLEAEPDHAGLRLAAARGFTQYAWAFVQRDAEIAEETSVARAAELRERARRLYRRAREHGLRGLEVGCAGFEAELLRDRRRAVRRLREEDVPLAYWTAAAWGAGIGLSMDDPETVADLPIVEALIDRALALDEGFGEGALHTFLVQYEPNRPGASKDAAERSREHFARALQLSRGRLAAPYVALAEAVALPAQDRESYESLLREALAVDPDASPDNRLENLVVQRRARWLLDRAADRFLE